MKPFAERPYRPGVGIMLLNSKSEVFVGQRLDNPADAWQMPQGGIDEGEAPLGAAWREMKEEIGTDKAELEAESKGWLSYDLPPDLEGTVSRPAAEMVCLPLSRQRSRYRYRHRPSRIPVLEMGRDAQSADDDRALQAQALPRSDDRIRRFAAAVGTGRMRRHEGEAASSQSTIHASSRTGLRRSGSGQSPVRMRSTNCPTVGTKPLA